MLPDACGRRLRIRRSLGIEDELAQAVEVVVGEDRLVGTAVGVDPESGALRLDDPGAGVREIDSGDVVRCRVV